MKVSDLVWLDLCSGLGGASQPAKDRGWRVIRVDIDPRFKPDIVADLSSSVERNLVVGGLVWHYPRPTVIWASSACTDFTKWGLPDSWVCNRHGKKEPDLELSFGCKAIIDWFKPEWWIFENVRASKRFLTPMLGPVQAETDGHVFWGRLPGLLPQTKGHKWRLPPSPARAALRAKIPYEIGEAICMAVERRLGVEQ